MEQISHSQHARRKRNSTKVNLTISIVIHVVLLGIAAFWAAREGYAGKGLQALTASLVPKEKKADTAKKAEEKSEEMKKAVAAAKEIQQQAKAVTATAPAVAPPPPPADVVAAAPPPVVISDINFDSVVTTDPVQSYKQQVESVLRNNWVRPPDGQDLDYVAEVELRVDAAGKIAGYEWKKGSGNNRWDDSVKKALAETKAVNRPPPKGFPEKVTVRFDVISVQEVPAMSQLQ